MTSDQKQHTDTDCTKEHTSKHLLFYYICSVIQVNCKLLFKWV